MKHCRLPIADFQLAIEHESNTASAAKLVEVESKSAIGNRK
jgi:hypothetical protein